MTVVLCGVGADGGNVRPVPTVDDEGRFEYVPIPEKGATTEARTYGLLRRRFGEGSLATLVEGVRPGSDGEWVDDPAAIREQAVHYDPNLEALTYGEHRSGYVAKLRELEAGDVVGFYGGFQSPTSTRRERYLFGSFVVAEAPTLLPPDLLHGEKAELLAAHPQNAHAKRFDAHGDLYYHDPAFTDRRETVALVPGREPGGLLDRAVKLSDAFVGPHYYMDERLAAELDPRRSSARGTHLGGFKPAVTCDVDGAAFHEFLRREVEAVREET